MKMTTEQMRELDAWIAPNVMRLSLCERHPAILNPNEFVLSIPSKIVRARIGNNPPSNFEPTTDPAAAMEVLKKCAEFGSLQFSVVVWKYDGNWKIDIQAVAVKDEWKKCIEAETLELAICLFAQKLFEK